MVVFLTGGKQLNYLTENKIKKTRLYTENCMVMSKYTNECLTETFIKYLAKTDTKFNF